MIGLNDTINTISFRQGLIMSLPTRRPIVILERVEDQFPEWREILVSAMCLHADQRIILSYCEDLYGPKNKMFSRKLMLPLIFCGLWFQGWFLVCIGFNVLCTFCNIIMIVSYMLVMICHVREIRHMYWFAVPISRLFESQYYINKFGDLDWVSFAPDRNTCRAPLNIVTSLQVL